MPNVNSNSKTSLHYNQWRSGFFRFECNIEVGLYLTTANRVTKRRFQRLVYLVIFHRRKKKEIGTLHNDGHPIDNAKNPTPITGELVDI